MKGNLSVVKVSDGKAKFVGQVEARLAKQLGKKTADKINDLIKSGKPLNATAIKALLGHKAGISKKISDFVSTKANSRGEKMSFKDNAKQDNNKVTILNPFAKKSSKFVEIKEFDVSEKKGVIKVEDMIKGLADKLGVNKDVLSSVTVRVAENTKEEKVSGISSKHVMGTFMPTSKIITVNKAFLKDVLENKGREASGILIHEMGHFIVGEKRAASGIKQHRAKRGLSAEEVAEELGVELLAQSLSDSRNHVGYEKIIAQGVKIVSSAMNISKEEAVQKIVDTGLLQDDKITPEDRRKVLGSLSALKLAKVTPEESIKLRDEALDIAVDIFGKRGFDVVREHKSKEAANYRSVDTIFEKRNEMVNREWQFVQNVMPEKGLVFSKFGGLPKAPDFKTEVTAKRAIIGLFAGGQNINSLLLNNDIPQDMKSKMAEISLFGVVMERVATLNRSKDDVVKEMKDSTYNKILSPEKINEIINVATEKETIATFNGVKHSTSALSEIVTLAPENTRPLAYALKIANVNGFDVGSGKYDALVKNADLVYAARHGDAGAMDALKAGYPEGYQKISGNIMKNAETLKTAEALFNNPKTQKMVRFAMQSADGLAAAHTKHPRKYGIKLIQQRLESVTSELKRNGLDATVNVPNASETVGKVLKQIFENSITKYKMPDKKAPEATNWTVDNNATTVKATTPAAKKTTPKPSAPKQEVSKPASKSSASTSFSFGQPHKDMITNFIMKQQMGQSTESLRESKPAVYKELEDNGYIANGRLTDKGKNTLIKK